MTWGEGGFQFSGAEPIKGIRWLRRSISVRLGMGKYTFGTFTGNSGGYEMADQAEFSFHTPVTVGLLAFPRKLHGFGAHVYAGADPLGWLLTRHSGHLYEKIDFGSELSYVLALKYFSLSVWGGWQRNSFVWGDFWMANNDWRVTAMLRFNLDPIRGK